MYKFKIESRNYVYFSDPSAEVEILCAAKPDIPTKPISSNNNDLISVDWDAPSNNGLPITSYTILVERKDGVFVQDLNYCVGSDSTLVANTQCDFSSFVLIDSPYSLVKDDVVKIKIAATNAYGTSDYSDVTD